MLVFVIIMLVIIILILVLYNISIHKKIVVFSDINDKISSLNVVQDFMDIVAGGYNVNEKLIKINELLINKYKFPYSSIVTFDGNDYVVKATNVDKMYWKTLSSLNEEPVFKESIQNATYQFLKVQKEGDRLPYQKSGFSMAKSAIFFPLYIENIYIGYWLIEGNISEEFDRIDFSVLELVRNNIVSVLRAVENQSIIENIIRQDKFTNLKTEEYMYGPGKKIIDKYPTSTVCMFSIINLEEINLKYGRRIGNDVIISISKEVDSQMERENVFVRYMGPKFVIVFSGKELNEVVEFMGKIKTKIEGLEFEKIFKNKKQTVNPKLNIAITTYYKGVALDNIAKNLEMYLDNSDKNESNINCI